MCFHTETFLSKNTRMKTNELTNGFRKPLIAEENGHNKFSWVETDIILQSHITQYMYLCCLQFEIATFLK